MEYLNKIFKKKKVKPFDDLRAGEKNDGVILFSTSKTYEVVAIVDQPTPYCFILKNEEGAFDIIHMSKFKEA